MLRDRFAAEIAHLGLPPLEAVSSPITEADLAPLPTPARSYLRFMGVVGRARDRSFRLGFVGRFKVKLHGPWRRCEVWQYNTSPEITRSFLMRIRVAGLPVVGRDTYRSGHGRMVGKLLELVTVIDGSGPDFDSGELATYLNDMVLIAPSMLLVPAVTFAPVDGRSFDVTLVDHGLQVKGRVFVDERGAPVDFESTDRFCDHPTHPGQRLRARWTTPVVGLQEHDGRRLISRGQAVWHLADGDHPYADFEVTPGSVAFNVRPGE